MYREINTLNEFRETGMDPDNDGETENNRDKEPNVAIASVKIVICIHNNPKLPNNPRIAFRRGKESSESAKKKRVPRFLQLITFSCI